MRTSYSWWCFYLNITLRKLLKYSLLKKVNSKTTLILEEPLINFFLYLSFCTYCKTHYEMYNLLYVQYCIITHTFLLHNQHLQYKPWVVSLCIPFVWISISHIFSILFFRLLGYYKGQCTILKKSTIQPNVENEIYLVHWPKLARAP